MERKPEADVTEEPRAITRRSIFALEVCFLGVIGVVVVGAFFEAFRYQLVSSRTPFVIMVPLLLLIGLQAVRLYQARGNQQIRTQFADALHGRAPMFKKIAVLHGWFLGFLVLINLAGHYIAMTAFVFMLIWFAAKERLVLAVSLSLGTTAVIYLLFQFGFGISLYPGLIYRYFAGYRIF